LLQLVEQIDQRLAGIYSPAPLRLHDLACAIGADENQLASVFEILTQKGVVRDEEMVECEQCQNLMPVVAFRQAIQDEDLLECTGCHRIFSRRSRSTTIYRLTTQSLKRTKANAKPPEIQISELLGLSPRDEPLSDRARFVLHAMLELDAVDSDRRRSTEDIAVKAIGRAVDANALKSVVADLKTRNLIDTKAGRGGGCWLTDRGQARAKKLRDANRNSATV